MQIPKKEMARHMKSAEDAAVGVEWNRHLPNGSGFAEAFP